ncbi:MAG: amino acid adenylation domain-containing protein [Planctomycetota bacterium]|jgi:amino acid adenylation domain-containing protein
MYHPTAHTSGTTERKQAMTDSNLTRLDARFHASVKQYRERIAVEDPGQGSLTYGELAETVAQLAAALRSVGITPGDRIGICCPKSIPSVAAILAALETGGAYVPVDATAPASRNAYIFQDCAVQAIIVDRKLVDGLRAELDSADLKIVEPPKGLDRFGVDPVILQNPVAPTPEAAAAKSTDIDSAYILYTSGSTGKPKGVIHTHASALAFVEWCFDEFEPTNEDVFSSHAPFHFDLSILDLYVPLLSGAKLVLISEENGKQPRRLAPLVAEHGITVWYSTPTILRLLVEFGDLAQHDLSKLRLVLFAGEVYPIKYLRALQTAWPHPSYYNLYGPTETNVCTFQAVPCPLPDSMTEAVPIGIACSGDKLRIVDESGVDVPAEDEGELIVAGASVMLGYWRLPEQSTNAFQVDGDQRWYRTGDIVSLDAENRLVYRGRRDRMVKRRGNRVELGEIEAGLYKHESIAEVAVLATSNAETGVAVHAFISWSGPGKAGVIAMKSFANANLPSYMVPDRFHFLDTLPKTSTDKISYQQLQELL